MNKEPGEKKKALASLPDYQCMRYHDHPSQIGDMKCFSSSYGCVRYIISIVQVILRLGQNAQIGPTVFVYVSQLLLLLSMYSTDLSSRTPILVVYIMAIHTYTQAQLVLSQELLGDGGTSSKYMYSGKLFGGLALTQSMAFANRVHQGVEGQNETQVFYIIILKKNCFVFWQRKMMKGKLSLILHIICM